MILLMGGGGEGSGPRGRWSGLGGVPPPRGSIWSGGVSGPGGVPPPGGRGVWSGAGLFQAGGVWSRGCLLWGVSGKGGLVWGVPGGDPHGTATAAGGTHPTGMHSCSCCIFVTIWISSFTGKLLAIIRVLFTKKLHI